MQKQRIILIVGIVLALIAVFMVNAYIGQQRQMIQEQAKKALVNIQANQTAILVARKDLARGTVIEAGMLETQIFPNQYVQPQAVTSLDRVAGMTTITSIAKGEQITLNKLTWPKETAAGGSLAMVTPVGKRAITISVDNISSLAGMIRPGDYVDVIAMVPVPAQTAEGKQATQVAVMPLFQNVLILAVGQETGALAATAESRYKKEEKKEISPLITLALGPQESSLIAFVQEQGKIKLSLRSPADSQVMPTQVATWDTLFQYIMPKETHKAESQKEEPVVSSEYVEIYRGLNKEKIPLSK